MHDFCSRMMQTYIWLDLEERNGWQGWYMHKRVHIINGKDYGQNQCIIGAVLQWNWLLYISLSCKIKCALCRISWTKLQETYILLPLSLETNIKLVYGLDFFYFYFLPWLLHYRISNKEKRFSLQMLYERLNVSLWLPKEIETPPLKYMIFGPF